MTRRDMAHRRGEREVRRVLVAVLCDGVALMFSLAAVLALVVVAYAVSGAEFPR